MSKKHRHHSNRKHAHGAPHHDAHRDANASEVSQDCVRSAESASVFPKDGEGVSILSQGEEERFVAHETPEERAATPSEESGEAQKAVVESSRKASSDETAPMEMPPAVGRSLWARPKPWLILLGAVAGVGLGSLLWLQNHLTASAVPLTVKTETVELMVEEGDGARRIMAKLREAGLEVSDWEMRLAARLHHRGMGRIHTGLYRFPAGVTRTGILDVLEKGPVIDQQIRIPDGATIWDVRRIVAGGTNLKPLTAGMSEEELKAALGLSDYPSLEGFFAPDTYRYGSGTTDLAVLKKAVARQKKLLEEAWSSRNASVAVNTPYEALILASIVEKETGEKSDRHLVSSVFHNRLKVRMPLQTDPTVIYGLGPDWNGNITKKDLQAEGPYNTYKIAGLPPTPISMPTPASIEAAVHPAESRYLYFVSRGDGSSEFTTNLADHNRAVRHYILEKRTAPLNLPKRSEEGPLRAR